jgi:hypothetical protein
MSRTYSAARQRLASALAEHHAPFRPGSRKGAAQLGQHRRIGFDRNDFGTQRDQRGGQLAGSGQLNWLLF